MRGLSLSYKESIDQVWQAAAVSGFFCCHAFELNFGGNDNGVEFFILYE